MRKLIFRVNLFITLIFFLLLFDLYSQEPTQSNDIPKLVKKNNICKELLFGKGSSSKKYQFRRTIYDSLGHSVSQIDFEEDGTIESRIISYYFGDSLEVIVYVDSTNVDTAKYVYKNGLLNAEYWYDGETKIWDDSTFYFYDPGNILIFKINTYLHREFDSLKYSHNKLVREICYNETNEKQKEIIYTYSGDLLISKFECPKYLKADSTYYSYYNNRKMKSKKGSNYTTLYFYYKNGFLRKRKTGLINEKVEKDDTVIRYNKKGFLKKITSYLDKQKTSSYKAIYMKCGKNKI